MTSLYITCPYNGNVWCSQKRISPKQVKFDGDKKYIQFCPLHQYQTYKEHTCQIFSICHFILYLLHRSSGDILNFTYIPVTPTRLALKFHVFMDCDTIMVWQIVCFILYCESGIIVQPKFTRTIVTISINPYMVTRVPVVCLKNKF